MVLSAVGITQDVGLPVFLCMQLIQSKVAVRLLLQGNCYNRQKVLWDRTILVILEIVVVAVVAVLGLAITTYDTLGQ